MEQHERERATCSEAAGDLQVVENGGALEGKIMGRAVGI